VTAKEVSESVGSWWRQLVAPSILITLTGGAFTTGRMIERSEVRERIAIINQRVMANEQRLDSTVSDPEYQATIARLFADIGEVKAGLNSVRVELVELRKRPM
jgi:tetrahydromethanopterin S-methyltransferase subunit F